jgi:hypothetical protein
LSGYNKKIDLEELYSLAKIGLSEAQVAQSLGISQSTMTRRKQSDAEFDQALKDGQQAGITAVTSALYTGATNADKPSTSAQIFYLKNRARWSDRSDVEISGGIGVEVQLDAAIDALKSAGIDPSKL